MEDNKQEAQEILQKFNEITGRRFSPTKTNLKGIENRLKDGFTVEQMIAVIQLKNLEWKNNEVMAVHLCPETIFRPKNFEKYVNQIVGLKNNPELLQRFNEQFNKTAVTGTASAFSKFDALFAKGKP